MRPPSLALLLLLLFPLAASQCATCGEGRVATKRIPLENDSTFRRVGDIELIDIYEITHERDLAVCGQRCDAKLACVAYEFKHGLCVVATSYKQTSDDLVSRAFETEKFIKVNGDEIDIPEEDDSCVPEERFNAYLKKSTTEGINGTAPTNSTPPVNASSTVSPTSAQESSAAQSTTSTGTSTTTTTIPNKDEVTSSEVSDATTSTQTIRETETTGAKETTAGSSVPSTSTSTTTTSTPSTTAAETTSTTARVSTQSIVVTEAKTSSSPSSPASTSTGTVGSTTTVGPSTSSSTPSSTSSSTSSVSSSSRSTTTTTVASGGGTKSEKASTPTTTGEATTEESTVPDVSSTPTEATSTGSGTTDSSEETSSTEESTLISGSSSGAAETTERLEPTTRTSTTTMRDDSDGETTTTTPWTTTTTNKKWYDPVTVGEKVLCNNQTKYCVCGPGNEIRVTTTSGDVYTALSFSLTKSVWFAKGAPESVRIDSPATMDCFPTKKNSCPAPVVINGQYTESGVACNNGTTFKNATSSYKNTCYDNGVLVCSSKKWACARGIIWTGTRVEYSTDDFHLAVVYCERTMVGAVNTTTTTSEPTTTTITTTTEQTNWYDIFEMTRKLNCAKDVCGCDDNYVLTVTDNSSLWYNNQTRQVNNFYGLTLTKNDTGMYIRGVNQDAPVQVKAPIGLYCHQNYWKQTNGCSQPVVVNGVYQSNNITCSAYSLGGGFYQGKGVDGTECFDGQVINCNNNAFSCDGKEFELAVLYCK